MAPSLYKIAVFLEVAYSHFNLLSYPLEEAPFLKGPLHVPRGTLDSLSFKDKILFLFKNLSFSSYVPRGTFSNLTEETLERFKIYEVLLKEWGAKINLISRNESADVWERHFLDSLQLLPYLESLSSSIIDIGSGAGFPGLVLVLSGAQNMILVESNGKKCLFLNQVAQETNTPVTILNQRLEDIKPAWQPHYITARAVASLDLLLKWSRPFIGPQTKLLFLKGKQANEEVKVASQKWLMHIKKESSITHEEGTILLITGAKEKR